MVGKPPDLESWDFTPSNKLIIPLNSILQRVMARIGIIEKESGCRKDVDTITSFLKEVDPINPISYDFAIYRLELLEICYKYKEKSNCEICPLNRFCVKCK